MREYRVPRMTHYKFNYFSENKYKNSLTAFIYFIYSRISTKHITKYILITIKIWTYVIGIVLLYLDLNVCMCKFYRHSEINLKIELTEIQYLIYNYEEEFYIHSFTWNREMNKVITVLHLKSHLNCFFYPAFFILGHSFCSRWLNFPYHNIKTN